MIDGGDRMHEINAQITFCATRDLEAAARFYEEVIGLPLVLDQGGCRIYRTTGDAYLGFCQRDAAPEPAGVILTLVTDDVDGWHERLSAAGIAFEKEPAVNPDYGIYHCFLRDPSGYLVEIQRFLDPRWSGRAASDDS
jgi:catechol 2,3-dioxygenase-like lactoylglutathione lyase family enzyme